MKTQIELKSQERRRLRLEKKILRRRKIGAFIILFSVFVLAGFLLFFKEGVLDFDNAELDENPDKGNSVSLNNNQGDNIYAPGGSVTILQPYDLSEEESKWIDTLNFPEK